MIDFYLIFIEFDHDFYDLVSFKRRRMISNESKYQSTPDLPKISQTLNASLSQKFIINHAPEFTSKEPSYKQEAQLGSPGSSFLYGGTLDPVKIPTLPKNTDRVNRMGDSRK